MYCAFHINTTFSINTTIAACDQPPFSQQIFVKNCWMCNVLCFQVSWKLKNLFLWIFQIIWAHDIEIWVFKEGGNYIIFSRLCDRYELGSD